MKSSRPGFTPFETNTPSSAWADNQTILEFAAWLATFTPSSMERWKPILQECAEEYRSASRLRHERWMTTLELYVSAVGKATGDQRLQAWKKVLPVAAEVVATEVLTRVWGAALAAQARVHGIPRVGRVALHVLHDHSETHYWVVQALGATLGLPSREIHDLHQLRYHAERWSDLLVAPFLARWGVESFAVDPQRCADFACLFFPPGSNSSLVEQLFCASLQQFFNHHALRDAPSAAENAQLAQGILNSLPQELLQAKRPALGFRFRHHQGPQETYHPHFLDKPSNPDQTDSEP